ncbi:uncharacterized protein LOC110462348 isoform X2 [Mizuhopecten yessoensis]|uniref:uncharacterized protein LOC110462348 isoform X1 n=1 Tax=Mizuhopecten yessoensis TaxID=6573 RepID=UPI000B45C7BA|nr:uncharacterized protein LOC110462348 isoform X1 [Mizuhopecten yessoensis]XP_021371963.1 uncharacterized protein LOC110462348 isoform X2 [Mizuhopecten yessoensis]
MSEECGPIQCKIGSDIIPMTSQKTYAGITFTHNLQSSSSIFDACVKGRTNLNSLLSIGIHPNGLNPVLSFNIIKSVVYSSMLYGCELWNSYTKQAVEELERTQRYACRRCIGLPKTSSTAVTAQCLGSFDMWSEVERRKLLFWNKLCLGGPKFLWKTLFIIRLCQFMYGSSSTTQIGFLPDIYNIMVKFNIESFINDYVLNIFVPPMLCWKRFINRFIYDFYYIRWTDKLNTRDEHKRYAAIHSDPGINPILQLSTKQISQQHVWDLVELFKYSISCENELVICKICEKTSKDIVLHFILECPGLYLSRDKMMDGVVNAIEVLSYVQFSELSIEDQCSFLLGDHSHVYLTGNIKGMVCEMESFL